ncbi:MAG: ATP-binding protein, partial [Mariniphaga sp.]|nr:ATP-binding protein [Mariniphaga sp.]
DEGKLRGIFMHLINNALKYTHEGNIGVGYRMLANRIEFFVSDTGIGISGAHQQTIFERFIQADMSLSSHYEGLGLGLTISKEYVKMLGGSLRLESEPCKGSVFFFDLPCQPVC